MESGDQLQQGETQTCPASLQEAGGTISSHYCHYRGTIITNNKQVTSIHCPVSTPSLSIKLKHMSGSGMISPTLSINDIHQQRRPFKKMTGYNPLYDSADNLLPPDQPNLVPRGKQLLGLPI